MTPEEKIESLREWAQRRLDNYKASAWGDGFTAAVQEIRDIIDPPALCDCGDVEDVRGCTVQRGGVLHTETWCGPCCTHGVLLSAVCEQCHPPTPKWRALVDEAAEYYGETTTPLADVLRLTALIAAPDNIIEPSWLLSRIIVVCEQTVGDGWRADPDDIRGYCSREERRVQFLLDAVANFAPPYGWQVPANRAAAWLRHILDGGAE